MGNRGISSPMENVAEQNRTAIKKKYPKAGGVVQCKIKYLPVAVAKDSLR